MNHHEKINYVEFPASDMAKTQAFFESVFGWKFQSYGPEYIAFDNQGIEGGFYKSNLSSRTQNGAALVVFFSEELEETLQKVKQAGGRIVKDIFSFPGGRRFQFLDPNGNEFGVWAEGK